MRRVLLDQNAPRGLRLMLPGHDVRTAYRLGWSELSNGELLAAAQLAGFDVIVTGDQNIPHQNNLGGNSLAVVVLDTTHWPRSGPTCSRCVRRSSERRREATPS